MRVNLEFKGEQFGVRLVQRGPNDPHACFELLTEDDEFWSVTGVGASTVWLDDLIEQLQEAKKVVETLPKSRDGCGKEIWVLK